jgi:hypothetical protein
LAVFREAELLLALDPVQHRELVAGSRNLVVRDVRAQPIGERDVMRPDVQERARFLRIGRHQPRA